MHIRDFLVLNVGRACIELAWMEARDSSSRLAGYSC